jgi:hypothetical protein
LYQYSGDIALRIKSLFSRAFGPSRGSDDQLPKVAVVGALRSGTNYLKFLLESNYHVAARFSDFGWKHAGVPVFNPGSSYKYPDEPLFFIVKNPYAFVISLHRYYLAYRRNIVSHDDFNRFLTQPIFLFDSQLKDSPQMRFSNPIQYWNYVYWNLENLNKEKFQVLGFNYEDLLENPAGIAAVEKSFRFRKKTSETVIPRNQLKRLGGVASGITEDQYETDESFDRSYYTEKKYLIDFSDEQLRFVRDEVDHALMARRSYPVV